MKDTVITLTLGIDPQEIIREVCAESACIALMSPSDGRSEVISPDNRALLVVYIDNAFVEFSAKFAAFIDAVAFNPPSNGIIELPMIIPQGTNVAQSLFRKLVERCISTLVLAACYESRPQLQETLRSRYDDFCSRLLRLLCA